MEKKCSVTWLEEMYHACNRFRWFTAGTNEQYKKLFEANEKGFSVREIAMIIWVCSDDNWTYDAILHELQKMHRKYLRQIRERQKEVYND